MLMPHRLSATARDRFRQAAERGPNPTPDPCEPADRAVSQLTSQASGSLARVASPQGCERAEQTGHDHPQTQVSQLVVGGARLPGHGKTAFYLSIGVEDPKGGGPCLSRSSGGL